MSAEASNIDQSHDHGHHVSSPAQLIGIFIALLALTGLTVAAAEFPFGEFDVWVALGIAGVKAFLVAAYYMHLRYDKPLNTMLLLFSIVVVVLFLGVTLSDVVQLVPEVEAAGN
jgi:cytochrome c oxidase subunit 4